MEPVDSDVTVIDTAWKSECFEKQTLYQFIVTAQFVVTGQFIYQLGICQTYFSWQRKNSHNFGQSEQNLDKQHAQWYRMKETHVL